ncbi:MAG: hypothetical protein RR893_09985 [Clostridia bacterium]
MNAFMRSIGIQIRSIKAYRHLNLRAALRFKGKRMRWRIEDLPIKVNARNLMKGMANRNEKDCLGQ